MAQTEKFCPQCFASTYQGLMVQLYDNMQWRCKRCTMTGSKFIFNNDELLDDYITGGKVAVKKLEYTWTHNNSIIDLSIITPFTRDRGYWKREVLPVIEVMKSQIPATSREYNPNTHKWNIAAEYWTATKKLFELMGFTPIEVKLADKNTIPGVEVPKEFEENFHYKQEVITTTESTESIAAQLSKFLDVEITTQDLNELKKLYRRKALELHPDRNGGDGSKMSELNRLWTLYCNTGSIQ